MRTMMWQLPCVDNQHSEACESQAWRRGQAFATPIPNASSLSAAVTRLVDPPFLPGMVPRTVPPEDSGIEAVHQAQMGRFWVGGVRKTATRQPTAVHCQCFTRPDLRGIQTIFHVLFFYGVVFSGTVAWLQLVPIISNALSPSSTAAVGNHQEPTRFSTLCDTYPVLGCLLVRPLSQEERWGGVDSRKKRNPSREDASVEAMDEDSEQPGQTEPKVGQE